MLLELRVENYAVIDSLTVEFAPGLNLLTGETGAGKSILIDALSLLLGDKASTDMIRHGAEKAIVSGVFEADEKRLRPLLEENGIEPEGNQVIVKREIAAGGKGRVFVNNQPATVALLRALAPALASIHAQNETILAFDERRVLDSWIPTLVTILAIWRKSTLSGRKCASGWRSLIAMSKTVYGWPTCGASRKKKLKQRSCIREKTRSWRRKSASWPIQKSFSERPPRRIRFL